MYRSFFVKWGKKHLNLYVLHYIYIWNISLFQIEELEHLIFCWALHVQHFFLTIGTLDFFQYKYSIF